MPVEYCLIENSSVEATELPRDLNDMIECNSRRAGGRYKITEKAYRYITVLSPSLKEKLIGWVSEQHERGEKVPVIDTGILKMLGLS